MSTTNKHHHVMHRQLIFLLFFVIVSLKVDAVKHPIILVPGDGGSQIEAKLDKPTVVHYVCQKKNDEFFNIWLNLELLVPVVIDCTVDNMRLQYNNQTRKTSNSPGVTVRVPGFGNSTTVEWLDPSQASPGSYFHNVAQMLVAQLGYIRGVDLHGAPYDFRKAPNEQSEYYSQLRSLIEETVKANGQPAVLLTHSMGGPLMLTFLQQQAQAWKDNYIRSFVTLAAPWGGTVKSLKVFAVGDNLGVFVLSGGTLRDQQRTSPSLSWLLPSKFFWKPSEILVSTSERNYSVENMQTFLSDISFPVGWEMRKDTEKYALDLTAPGVEVHCIHGYDVETVESLKYGKGKFPDGSPELVMGDGDGTVNRRSLEGCVHWSPKRKSLRKLNSGHTIYHEQIPGLDHMAALRDDRIVQYLRDLFAHKINSSYL